MNATIADIKIVLIIGSIFTNCHMYKVRDELILKFPSDSEIIKQAYNELVQDKKHIV